MAHGIIAVTDSYDAVCVGIGPEAPQWVKDNAPEIVDCIRWEEHEDPGLYLVDFYYVDTAEKIARGLNDELQYKIVGTIHELYNREDMSERWAKVFRTPRKPETVHITDPPKPAWPCHYGLPCSCDDKDDERQPKEDFRAALLKHYADERSDK